MTLLIATTVWVNYRYQLQAHGMPQRETASAYLEKITQETEEHLQRKEILDGDWWREGWEYHPQNIPDYFAGSWMNPALPADVVIPFVRVMSALGYDPNTMISYHFDEAQKNLRSLSPLQEAFYIPIVDENGNPAATEDLRHLDPRDAFEKPLRRSDPNP